MNKLAFVACATIVAAAASATPLLPGGSVSPLTYYTNTLNTVVPVQPATFAPFASANFSGTLVSWVFANAADNPYGPGHLTFVYQVRNDATSTDSLGRLSVNGYSTFGTDVGMDPVGVGLGLIDAFENTRSADGGTLGWSFLNLPPAGFQQVGAGQQSSFFVVHTDATQYFWSTAAVIDGAIANTNAWAPLPTPGAGALLSLGLLASARRRTR
ncbi:MAG: hypothetical protein QM783_17440 [Phycisphaerales bacterium]